MGLYVAGTALGGMTGRVGLGIVADQHGWAIGLLGVSALCLVGVGVVWRLMPAVARDRAARPPGWVSLATWLALVCDRSLMRLFLCGGLASGLFVSAYNYAGFRLQAEPFLLSPAQIGLIFCCYAFGVMSSGVAGRLALRWGQRRVLWVSVSITAVGVLVGLAERLPVFVSGMCLMTVGFFAMHAVCSGWVGLVAPPASKAQATALYLLSYYMGSSVLGYLGGWAWDHGGWPGLSAGLIVALFAFMILFRGVSGVTTAKPGLAVKPGEWLAPQER
jgi:YNFM family putative membrane transporter